MAPQQFITHHKLYKTDPNMRASVDKSVGSYLKVQQHWTCTILQILIINKVMEGSLLL